MSSLFGDDDGVEDLLNDNLKELPSGDEGDDGQLEGLFGDDDGQGEGEKGDQEAIKVEPKKRSVRNPRPRLTVETLSGPRGIQTIEDYFKDIKFKGKGYESENLDEILRRMQHWAHRMYPTYKFDDVLNNIERLGKKKPLQVHMSRYRLGMLEQQKLRDGIEEEGEDIDGRGSAAEDEPFDEFDALLGEQIAMSKLATRTPGNTSKASRGPHTADMTNNSFISTSTFATPSFNRGNAVMSTPYTGHGHKEKINDNDLARPLPPSQPGTPTTHQLTEEQKARMEENRRVAMERLAARKARLLQQQKEPQSTEAAAGE